MQLLGTRIDMNSTLSTCGNVPQLLLSWEHVNITCVNPLVINKRASVPIVL